MHAYFFKGFLCSYSMVFFPGFLVVLFTFLEGFLEIDDFCLQLLKQIQDAFLEFHKSRRG